MNLVYRSMCTLLMVMMVAAGPTTVDCSSDESSAQGLTPPPPPLVMITGELINMTDFARPRRDSWQLARPNRNIRLDVHNVMGLRRLWNSRVTVEGYWSHPANVQGRVFVVVNIYRA